MVRMHIRCGLLGDKEDRHDEMGMGVHTRRYLMGLGSWNG